MASRKTSYTPLQHKSESRKIYHEKYVMRIFFNLKALMKKFNIKNRDEETDFLKKKFAKVIIAEKLIWRDNVPFT